MGRGDVVALAVLLVVPVLAFVVPAALGHPVLPGDDGAQNFPLRVLVGNQLRAGHLPVLALPIWSGSQLLAGWNAGAAYPFTWLFAIMPGTAAWAANLVLVWWVAGLGLFAFLRVNRLRPFPAALGSVSFVFAGAMDAQVVHFGLVAGVAWVPLQLLAILRLSGPGRAASRARWGALLAVAAAMTILAGEPRAIDVAVVVSGVYALWRLARAAPHRLSFFGWLVGAGCLAAALAAVQLLPGLRAVSASQRAGNSAALFTSGSLPLRWLLLLLQPNLLGGSGSFGAPPFVASYNLTEVTGYVGLLPWVAAFALLAQLRRRRPLPEWVVWHVVAAVGIVLALGGSTPAWHLLVHVPLFGSQRLQSRNIMVVDLAVAVLLAFWVDNWLSRARLADTARISTRREQLLGVLPAVGAMASASVSIAWGAGMLGWLGVSASAAAQDGGIRPWFVPTIVLGAAAAVLVLAGHRWTAPHRRVALGAFVAADILCFAVLSLLQVAPSSGPAPAPLIRVEGAADPQPTAVVPVATLGIPGRFAVYDPALIQAGAVHAAGAPDQNLLVGGWSLQGYTAIVDGFYASATGTHGAMGFGQDIVSVPAIGNGTLDQLDPGALLTLPEYLLVNARSAAALASSGSSFGPDPAAGRRTLAPGGRATWYFGEPIDLSSVTVHVTGVPPTRVELGLLGPTGGVTWLGATSPASGVAVPGTGSVRSPSGAGTAPEAAPGSVAVRSTEGSTGGTLVVSVAGGTRAVGMVARTAPGTGIGGTGIGGTAPGTGIGGTGIGGTGIGGTGTGSTGTGSTGTGASSTRIGTGTGTGSTGPTTGTGTAATIGVPLVRTATGANLQVDGVLQGVLSGGRWRYAGRDGPIAVFAATHPTPPLTLRARPGYGLVGATVQARSGPALAPWSATVDSPQGVVVVRAVAAIAGWSARWQPKSGPVRTLPVRRMGLVQAVTVPAGSGVLSWVYRAPGLRTAAFAGAAGLAALVVLLVIGRPRRRARSRSSAAGVVSPGSGLPDVAVRQQAVPDTAVCQQAVPDVAVRQQAVPDTAVSQQAVPDVAVRQQAVPGAPAGSGPAR